MELSPCTLHLTLHRNYAFENMVENIKDIRFDDEFAFSTSAGSLLQLVLYKEVRNARWYNGPCINSYSPED